ncbi:MAG: hypothetical protein EYC70_02700 [Planctomycetota bacterium]|nr:MAG: hypothetical protein EYC70_02700 [Planctomycetota bacterium]
MSGGELGRKTGAGQYEDNDIPGARDPGEAYDRALHQFRCTIGERKTEGPKGFVTGFEPDFNAAPEITTEEGAPQVVHMGSETCVIIPRFQVQKTQGTQTVYRWYDCWCERFGIEGDAWIELEEVSRQRHTKTERYALAPHVRCDTDWVKWFLEQLGKLTQAGLSGAKLMAAAEALGQERALPAGLRQGLQAALAPGAPAENVPVKVRATAARRKASTSAKRDRGVAGRKRR